MALESLLLSRDPEVVRVLLATLEKLSIGAEICRGAESGTEIIFSEKFDAVIVDCDDLQGGIEVLQDLRKSPSNRSAIAFAILNGATTTHKAFEKGANFVLQKPISPLNAMRCFSAGLGLMLRERRRYFRQPIELAVVASHGGNQEVHLLTSNLSEGGMAVRGAEGLTKSGTIKVSFSLPGIRNAIETKAEIVWQDANGRAGIRFLEMNPGARQSLDSWIEKEAAKAPPAESKPRGN